MTSSVWQEQKYQKPYAEILTMIKHLGVYVYERKLELCHNIFYHDIHAKFFEFQSPLLLKFQNEVFLKWQLDRYYEKRFLCDAMQIWNGPKNKCLRYKIIGS